MSTKTLHDGNISARGSALIVALAIVLLLASISAVLVSEMTTRAKNIEVDLEDIKAFEAAEAGIDAALHDINSAPVYQPHMVDQYVPPPSGLPQTRRHPSCLGQLNANGTMPTYPGYPLMGPQSGKPLTVHVAKRADGGKPGCLGTSNWNPATDDLDANGRPTWRPLQMRNAAGNLLVYQSGTLAGRPRYCEDNIVPQSLGSVAFFTYAVDWFHDGADNDGDGMLDGHNERNKYTVYSTGIHRGITQSGVTESGKVVTIEVMVQALDKDFEQVPHGALEVQIKPR